MAPIDPLTLLGLSFALGIGFGVVAPALWRRSKATAAEPATAPVPVTAIEAPSKPKPEEVAVAEMRRPKSLHGEESIEGEPTDLTRFMPMPAPLPSLGADEGDLDEGTPSVSLVSYIDQLESSKTTTQEPLVVSAAGRTDMGKRRRRNDDRYVIVSDEQTQRHLFAVVDGMGGHGAGGLASRLAAEVVTARFGSPNLDGSRSAQRPTHANALVWAIEHANRVIFETGKDSPQLEGMGATIVAAVYDEATRCMYIAHVGDSRAYRLRRGRCELLTVDHTVAHEGPMTAYLRRALGVRRHVKVDVLVASAEQGDTYLLCSDGLSSMKTNQEIATLLAAKEEPSTAATKLVDEANAAGGKDNIAVVVIRLEQRKEARTTGEPVPVASSG